MFSFQAEEKLENSNECKTETALQTEISFGVTLLLFILALAIFKLVTWIQKRKHSKYNTIEEHTDQHLGGGCQMVEQGSATAEMEGRDEKVFCSRKVLQI